MPRPPLARAHPQRHDSCDTRGFLQSQNVPFSVSFLSQSKSLAVVTWADPLTLAHLKSNVRHSRVSSMITHSPIAPRIMRMSFAPLLAVSLLFCTGTLQAAATFTPLGHFGGVRSGAYDVSADGAVIVGLVSDASGNSTGLFRWTAAESIVRGLPTGTGITVDSVIACGPRAAVLAIQ